MVLRLTLLLCLVIVVTACGRGVESRPISAAELQTSATGVTLALLTANAWDLKETTDADPFAAHLPADESLIFSFRNDYTGTVQILRAGATTPEGFLTFRWAVDWNASHLSIRYESGAIVDYRMEKQGDDVRLTAAGTSSLYVLSVRP